MAKKTTDEDEDQTTGTGEESEEDDEDPTAGTGEDSEDEDDDDEDDEEAVLATLTPAQAKLVNALQERLTKANASSARRRMALKALRSGKGADGTKPAPKPGPPKTDDGKNGNGTKLSAGFDPEEFRAQLIAELRAEQQAEKIQATAEKKLRAAGLILPAESDAAERKLKRVLGMLDLKNIELDELEDEIDDLKRDSPELFGKVKTKRPAAGGVGGPARVAGNKTTPAGKIAELFD